MALHGDERPGTALLLAAAPGRDRLIDAGSVFTTLAAVPPNAWIGTPAGTLIELTDPVDPQAVHLRIKAAAASDGPLSVVIVGQLQHDRRKTGVHLALARTTPSTIRRTALPWAWIVADLQQRAPGTTTLHLDLVADPDVWQVLEEGRLPLPAGTRAYGVISPPPGRRHIVRPTYTHALAKVLRAGQRLSPGLLHQEALRRAAPVEGAHILGREQPAVPANNPLPSASQAPAAPAPSRPPAVKAPAPTAGPAPAALDQLPPPQAQGTDSPVHVPVPVEGDPHRQIAALAQAGRHQEAAALAAAAQQRAVQDFGADTFAGVHWVEVRAHLASVANDPGQSCALWMQAARARLGTLQQAPDTPDVESAVDRAHHQWDRIPDAAHAHNLAAALLRLRHQVPGRQHGALQLLLKRLAAHQTPDQPPA
ncbi:hypothetical protein ACZ90_43670 [Streptomyces albus subsp. albus]|nr:hypothetical protein ACZ90_43670 [Streptomyces albus subsp. albus]